MLSLTSHGEAALQESKRLFPPAYLLGTLLVMLGLYRFFPVTTLLPIPWNLAGTLLLIVGIILNLQGAGLFQAAGTTIRPGESSAALVTHGVYRLSRNPMYLGFVLILLGAAGLLGALTPFFTIPWFLFLIQQRFILAEERMLSERFSAAYNAYCLRVRRWI